MRRKRVLVYVQHLLGIGHLVRAAALARGLCAQGLEVVLASGGRPVPGLRTGDARLVQLPPAAAADLSFRTLVDADGQAIDERWKRARADALFDAWRAFEPHALIIELFPFGRRQMRFELLPLLDAARTAARRPVIVSSVRDILGGGQRDVARQDAMLALFERHFDHLLVHGDPALVPFERTFVHAARLGGRLHYTGYVVDAAPADGSAGRGEVIVSAGGGAVGLRLMAEAIRARPLTALAQRTWRLLAGVNVDDDALRALGELAAEHGGAGVVIERARPDFATLLANCELSVSQAGYNTTVEILQAGTKAVAVPFAAGGETEQTLRARLLAARGRIELVEDPALDARTLAAAIDRAALRPRPGRDGIDLDGARRSAKFVADWVAERDPDRAGEVAW